MLFCDETGRTVGLWNFYSVKQQIDNGEPERTEEQPPAKKIKTNGGPAKPVTATAVVLTFHWRRMNCKFVLSLYSHSFTEHL